MDDNRKKRRYIIILILLIFILLYLLIRQFGYIEHHGPQVPTGNVDIFEIDCECCEEEETKHVIRKINKKEELKSEDNDNNKSEPEEEELDPVDLYVYDNYKVWDQEDLRIFSNPAFEYRSIIAPGSFNSYAFVIRNNNDFDVIYDISFKETNNKNINMKYKLKQAGNYLIGSDSDYKSIVGKKITGTKLEANSQKAYILDWKWIDAPNDAAVGFDINSTYKLSIKIGVNKYNENN